tara:strand:+ start:3160 stop:4014 length:855 start_codon:yes stop_codon:yes gene_type:complete
MNYEIEMMKYANNFKKISLNKKIGIEHKKNVSGELMGTNIYLDKNGFRVKNQSTNNNNKNKNIIMLGDSMTFGWGANETFSSLLDKKINSYNVLNAGIGNTNTIMQINNFFDNFSTKFRYDVIILNFFINDLENVIVKKPNFFQKYSYLYTFVNNKINTILIKFRLKDDWKSFYSENYLDNEIKKNTLFLINKLNNYCLNNNIKFLIHNIPELRDLNNYKFEKETKIIKDFAKSKKILYIDSFDKLKNYRSESLWVTPLDPHANDKAHNIIADNLFENLKFLFN